MHDLGLFDGPPLKGAAIVTDIAAESLGATSAAFVAFNDMAGEAVLRSVSRRLTRGVTWPLQDSVVALVRETNGVIAVSDLVRDALHAGERVQLGMSAVLASPVLGPDEYPIGALVAFDAQPRVWTRAQHRKLDNLAYLVTQEITLRASFATLQLMAQEFDPYRVKVQSSEQ